MQKLTLAILFTLCAVTLNAADNISISAWDTYTHKKSNISFPPRIKGFDRVAARIFKPDKSDIGVGYNDMQTHVIITIYIYPQSQDIIGECNECIAAINQAHNLSHKVKPTRDYISFANQKLEGVRAALNFEQPLFSIKQKVTSEIRIYKYGSNFLKIRQTYPSEKAAECSKRIETLLGALDSINNPKNG